MSSFLAEIRYPRIDPVLVDLGFAKIRWYGVSYVLAFAAAYLVLRSLARRGRWPVEPDRVADVLFWGILGVLVGGRVGWYLFYGLQSGHSLWDVWKVWEGGMSFHGGLAGVVVAYLIFAYRTGKPVGVLFDGLTLATPIGILFVRLGNFVNAELPGRPWQGPWAMRFPIYDHPGLAGPDRIEAWETAWARSATPREASPLWTDLRHPSQLYEAFAEGLLLFFILRWLMLSRGIGGGRIAGFFLILYGAFRFFIEFVRTPDADIGFVAFGWMTMGQVLCFAMVLAGALVLWLCRRRPKRPGPSPEGQAAAAS